MPTRYIQRSSALVGSAGLPNANSIRVDAGSEMLLFGSGASGTTEKVVADLSSAQTLSNKTISGLHPVEILTGARVLTIDDSGKTFYLSLAAGFAVTLPAVALAAGFRAIFIVKTAPTTAYTIGTPGAAQILAGGIHGTAGGDEDEETAATATTVNFVANVAVIGDEVHIHCDGEAYYARGFTAAAGGITITG